MTSKTHVAATVVRAIVLISVAAIFSGGGIDANAADLKILCASGMREVVSALQPQFERTTGQRVTVGFGEAGDLRKRIQGGEIADVIVLPRVVLDQVLSDGNVVPGTIVDLAQSVIGIGVRADAPKPDIGSADGLKRVLLAAKSIVTTDPASGGVAGVHVANVFQRLGISEQLKPKLKLTRGQRNAEFVAKGEAEIAFQLSNEIRIVPGIEFIPLPPEFERTFIFSAAQGSNATEPSASKLMLQFLSGAEAMAVIRAKGMDAPASK
jgi:molybdate transport system substrate-binding protein